MTSREANSVLDLLRHLDGSQQLDPTDLIVDVEALADAARVALGGALPVDLDVLLDTLGQVEQRFSDGGWYDGADEPDDGWRGLEDAPVGDRL